MRLYVNFADGMLDIPADSSSTVIESLMFEFLPVLSGGDTMSLTLDPRGEHGAPEVVTVTSHASQATDATVLRGQEGTAARAHPGGTRVISALVASDLETLRDGLGIAEGDIQVLEGDVSVLEGDVVGLGSRITPLETAPPAHTHDASDVTSGTLNSARIPNLNASKITAGTLSADRIPNLNASKITAGTLSVARIPNALGAKSFTTVTASGNVVGNNLNANGDVVAQGEVYSSGGSVRVGTRGLVQSSTSGDGRLVLRGGRLGPDSHGGEVVITDTNMSCAVTSGASRLTLGSLTYRWLTLFSTTDVDFPSDERLKDNIELLGQHDYEWTHALENINPIEFDKDGEHHFGFSAQNVREFLPEVIREDAEGFLSMSTSPMVAVLWQAVKELQARIEVLEQP